MIFPKMLIQISNGIEADAACVTSNRQDRSVSEAKLARGKLVAKYGGVAAITRCLLHREQTKSRLRSAAVHAVTNTSFTEA
jgi:hypothetical protein